jgi:hypothetical protein
MTKEVAIFGIRTNYVSEVAEILCSQGLVVVTIDNHCSSDRTRIAKGLSFILAAGTPKGRRELANQAQEWGLVPGSAAVHNSSVISPRASLSDGVTVNKLVSIGSGSLVGKHVQINRSSSVGHDTQIGDYVTIGPGVTIAGEVNIADGAFIGAGATILPQLSIGRNATIGAGAVVTRNVQPGDSVVGVPARPI